MPLVKCPDCNTSVSDKAAECPKCKRPGPFAIPAKKKSGCLKSALIIIFLFFTVLMAAIFISSWSQDRQREAEEKRVSKMTGEQRAAYYKEQQEKQREEAAALEEKRKAREVREAEETRKKAAEKAKNDEIKCRDETMAFVMSQAFVKKRLKAPASADFPYITNNRDVKTKYLGGCTHEVWAYVDSQNSFGAKIRTSYYVKLKYDAETNNWQLLDSEFYE